MKQDQRCYRLYKTYCTSGRTTRDYTYLGHPRTKQDQRCYRLYKTYCTSGRTTRNYTYLGHPRTKQDQRHCRVKETYCTSGRTDRDYPFRGIPGRNKTRDVTDCTRRIVHLAEQPGTTHLGSEYLQCYAFWWKSFHTAKKKTKRLKGFKFRTFIGRSQVTSWQWRG